MRRVMSLDASLARVQTSVTGWASLYACVAISAGQLLAPFTLRAAGSVFVWFGDEGRSVARPEASNTGLNVELRGSLPTLTNENSRSLSTARSTYDAKRFINEITVTAANVTFTRCQFDNGLIIGAGGNRATIKNCKIVGGQRGIRCWDGATNILIENVEIDGSAAPKALNGKGIAGYNFTARRCHIHHTASDGIFVVGDDTLIEWNYIHDVSYGGFVDGTSAHDDHADGIQLTSGSPPTNSHHVWRFNHISLPARMYAKSPWGSLNSCMTVQSCDIDSFVIEGNWLYGGGYTLRIEEGGSTIRGGVVKDNKVGPHPPNPDVLFGPLSNQGAEFSETNNRYAYPGDPTADNSLAFGVEDGRRRPAQGGR